MAPLPKELDKLHWQRQRDEELAWLSQATGMTPDEIEADLAAPDPHAQEVSG